MNFAQTFKALSNPIRRSILSLLKQADLIREEKEKNFIYYELNTSVLEDLMVWLVDLKGDSTDENE